MKSTRLLLVEDDKVDQMAFKRFVKEENLPYEVVIADSVSAARPIIASEEFDIVISDYALGDGTALDILDSITDTPIIVVTGAGDEKIAVQALKRGAYDYLIKDLDRNYLSLLPLTVDNAIRHAQAEQQNKLLSHAMLNISESVCITDRDDRVIFVNKAFTKMYGYQAADVIGQPYQRFYGERPSTEFDQPKEFYHPRNDGQEFPVALSRSILRDDNDNSLVTVEVARDITLRKQAEEALRYRVRFEKIITTLSTLFIYLDPDDLDSGIEIALQTLGDFMQADRSFIFLLSDDKTTMNYAYKWYAEGIEPLIDDLPELSVADYPWSMEKFLQGEAIHIPQVADLPPEAKADKELMQSLGAKSAIAIPMIYRQSLVGFLGFILVRTEKRWSEDTVSLLKIVGEILVNAFQRWRAEQALRESEARKGAILESAPDCIITIDHEGNIIEFNPAAEKTFGYTCEQVAGKRMVELLLPDFLSRQVQGETDADRSIDEAFVLEQRFETTATRADGTQFPVEMALTPIPLDGAPLRTAFLRDITKRKRAEQAERELMQMKDEFVASVSHELRTPLHSIKGFVELLRAGKVAEPDVQQEFLDRISQDVGRLTTLVNDLLDLSRLEAGQLQLELEDVNLSLLINETLQSLRTLAGNKEILLQYEPLDSDLVVHVDRHRLQQVLINLVGNAIKFSEPHRPIKVCEQVMNGQVMVRINDQGPGIPPEALPRLFSKFYQIDKSLKRRGQGTGLGLYISKMIVEAHSGRIDVESKLDEGSTFYFTLPLPNTG